MGIDVKQILSQRLSQIFPLSEAVLYEAIEIPPDPRLGDFAIPCFYFAREMQKNPAQIASDFAIHFSQDAADDTLIHRTEAHGSYLNLFVNKGHIIQKIIRHSAYCNFEDLRERGRGKTVVIDYSSPNVAKPFGIGHLRSTVIGSSLKRIFTFLGYCVIGINHLGDWGTQFGKLITAFKKWGDEKELDTHPIHYLYSLYVKFHSEAEKKSSLDDEARKWFKLLEQGDQEARRLWQHFKDLSLIEFKTIYVRLGVEFEHYTGESYYRDMIDETVAKVKARGITTESEGALIVSLGDDIPPALMKKSDDSTLYLTRDIAAALYRHRNYHFDIALYVVGSPQTLHFKQVFRVLEAMGYDWFKNCYHVPFGQIRFADRSMSTRMGNVVFLDDVLDKSVELALEIVEEKNPGLGNKQDVAEAVGVGAIIFNDLKNNRIKDITFNWDEMLNFNGETGPYLQYTYARIHSLLEKFKQTYGDVEFKEDLPFGDEGYRICMLLSEFENTVVRAAKEFEPSVISRYLLEVASQFNNFYNSYRVISKDRSLSLTRALIAQGVMRVLGEGLHLLGIKTVDEM